MTERRIWRTRFFRLDEDANETLIVNFSFSAKSAFEAYEKARTWARALGVSVYVVFLWGIR
jgi:transposase